MENFDASIPRKMFWSDKVPNKVRCPRCHSRLEKEYCSYLAAVQIGGEIETLLTGNDLGAFCTQCPIVVLDREGFGKQLFDLVREDMPSGSLDFGFTVVGIINMDAIPDDKENVPIGSDDNPLPLVEFVDTIEGADVGDEGKPGGKRLSGNQRRRLRKLQGRSGA